MERIFKPGDIVKHFKRETVDTSISKNKNAYLYKIIDTAIYTETGEKMVVYQLLYEPQGECNYKIFDLAVRPYDMFMSEVDHEKYPDIKQKYRFEKYDKFIVFLSHNMSELNNDEIYEIRHKEMSELSKKYGKDIVFTDNFNHINVPINAGNIWHLGASISLLDDVNFIHFCNKSDSRGCQVERLITELYKIPEI